MANVREYVGARYVPVFADPVEWDDTRTYEPLMMVQHLGETYMTRQAVPIGIQLPDTSQGVESNDYWVHMSNWNAQIEAYRQEVLQYNGRISDIETSLPNTFFNDENTVQNAIESVENSVDDLDEAVSNIKGAIQFEGANCVFYGDSTMVSTADNSDYPYIFGQLSGANITNRAIGGTSVNAGSSNDFLPLMENVGDLTDFDYLFFSYGINDWQNSKTIAGDGFNAQNNFGDSLAKALRAVFTKNPNIKVVCITSNYCYRTFGTNEPNVNNHGLTLEDYVNETIRICNVFSIPYLDAYRQLGINYKNYSNEIDVSPGTSIYVHPNANNRRKIALMLYNEFFGYHAAPNYIADENKFAPSVMYGSDTPISSANGTLAAYTASLDYMNPPFVVLKPGESKQVFFPKVSVGPGRAFFANGFLSKEDFGLGTSLDVAINGVSSEISSCGEFSVMRSFESKGYVESVTFTNNDTLNAVLVIGNLYLGRNKNGRSRGYWINDLTSFVDTSIFTNAKAYIVYDGLFGKLTFKGELVGSYTAATWLKVFSINLWMLNDGNQHLGFAYWNKSGVKDSFDGRTRTSSDFGNAYVMINDGYQSGTEISFEIIYDAQKCIFPQLS